MKTTTLTIRFCAVVLIGLITFTSCKKEIEFCIDGDMNPASPGQYTYTWCGVNADHIEWSINGTKYSGESVSLNFDQKSRYYLDVTAHRKKKQSTKSYSIKVGTKELRVEPKDCNGNYLSGGSSPRAYLYHDRNDLQTDFRNGNKNNCLDSIDLTKSTYYNNTNANSTSCWNAGFESTYPDGDYLVYVEIVTDETMSDFGRSNLAYLIAYGNTNISLDQNSEYDANPYLPINSTNSISDNQFLKRLYSKSFMLTYVAINGVSTGVPACNADDYILFNMDGTWEHHTGLDDCGGSQTNSYGTISYPDYCMSTSSMYLYANTESGDLAPTFYVTYYSSIQIKVQSTAGGSTVEQIFTVQ